MDTAQAPLADSALTTPDSATNLLATNVTAANVIAVQKQPSMWGDRLIFEQEVTPITRTLPLTAGVPSGVAQPFVYYVQSVEAASPGQAVAVPAIPATLVETPRLASEDGWQVATTSGWESPVVTVAGVAAEYSFLQAVGFQRVDVVTAPIQTGDTVIGFVELGRAVDLVDEPLGAIRRALGMAAGASALLAIAVGLVMSRTLTAPIQSLAEAAAAMSSGDLTARAPKWSWARWRWRQLRRSAR